MAPHDELNGRLAFAHAGVASDHDALAINIKQHAMPGNAGSQHPVQVLNGAAGKGHRHLICPQQGFLVFQGTFDALREAVQAPGNDQGGNVIEEEVVEALAALGLREPPQVGDLRFANNLEAAGVKIVIKAVELEARTVQVRHSHQGAVKVAALVQHLQMKEGYEILHL